MNKLDTKTRAQILNMLVDGSGMRAISRVCDLSFNTVVKLLEDAGEVCAPCHDENVRGANPKKIQCDEIWAFCYAKDKNIAAAKAAPDGAGDVWTWTRIDADSNSTVAWLVGNRDADSASAFMNNVASRLVNRVQLTTDGLKSYLEAVEGAFGADIDFAQQRSSIVARQRASKDAISLRNARGSKRPRSEKTPAKSTSQPATLSAKISQCERECGASRA